VKSDKTGAMKNLDMQQLGIRDGGLLSAPSIGHGDGNKIQPIKVTQADEATLTLEKPPQYHTESN
jgi:hypothetical protein